MAFAGRLVEQTSFSNILLGPLLVVKKVADGEEKGAWAEVCQAFNSKVRYLAYEKVSCSESYQGNKGQEYPIIPEPVLVLGTSFTNNR